MNPHRLYKNNSYILGISSTYKKAITGNVIWTGIPVVKINNKTLQAKYQILSPRILYSILLECYNNESKTFKELNVSNWNRLYILFYSEEYGWQLRECNCNDLTNIYTQGLGIAPKFFRDNSEFQENGRTFREVWDCADEALDGTGYYTEQALFYLFKLITHKYKLKESLFCFKQESEYCDYSQPYFSIEMPNLLTVKMAMSVLEFCDRYKLSYHNIDFINTPLKSEFYKELTNCPDICQKNSHVIITFDSYDSLYYHEDEESPYINELLDYNWTRNKYSWEYTDDVYQLTHCDNIRDFIDTYNSYIPLNDHLTYVIKPLRTGAIYKISKNDGVERDLLKELLLLHHARGWINNYRQHNGNAFLEIKEYCIFNKKRTEIIVIEKEQRIQLPNDYDYDYSYTQEELDDMYRDAFEGDPEAVWNID